MLVSRLLAALATVVMATACGGGENGAGTRGVTSGPTGDASSGEGPGTANSSGASSGDSESGEGGSSGGPAVPIEVIGPYEVYALPTTASMTGEMGGTSIFLPLNVIDAAITVHDAFTGSPALDDGWANVPIVQRLDLQFARGSLTNGPGPDLLLCDSYPDDSDEYTVSTGYDGFVAQLDVDDGAGTVVEQDRDYYLVGEGGPYQTDVLGLEIDLQDLGVPPGESVTSVRLVCRHDYCDPMAVASLVPPS